MSTARYFVGGAKPRAWLARLDPRIKLLWLLWISTLSVTLDSVLSLVLLFLLAAIGPLGLTMRTRGWLLIVALLAAIAWSTLLSQAMFYAQMPRTILVTLIPAGEIGPWQHAGLHLYREGMSYGLTQSLRMLAVTLAGLSVVLSTGADRLLVAMSRLRVPVAVGFVAITALRFVPVVISELRAATQARLLRGSRRSRRNRLMATRGLSSMIRPATSVLLPVLAGSVRRAETLATSVTSRGFDPAARRTFYPPLRLSPAEWILLATLAIVWTAVVCTKLAYWLYLAEIYYHPSLRAFYDVARRWL